MDARQHVVRFRIASIVSFSRQKRVYEVLMAVDAGVLRDEFVARFDLDWVVIVVQRKGDRVEQPVIGLGDPLAHEVMRQVAIVASRHMMMAALLP